MFTYLTGQNHSLELMFAKFVTAKSREKLNPLKVSSNRCYMPETTPKMCKTFNAWAPSWDLKRRPHVLESDVQRSMTSL